MREARDLSDGAWIAGLLLVTLLAALVRFDGLAEPSLWYDEILHVERAVDVAAEAADRPWYTWPAGLSADRENGSLYYLGQILASRLADGELGVRLAPALLGVASVLALCFVGTFATGNRVLGLAAGGLLALSPLHVYYSREGRPYAAVMLAVVLLLLLALAYRRRWTRWAAYPVALATAYLGAVAAPVLLSACGLAAVSWWIFRHRSREVRRGHLVLATGLALAVLPMIFPQVHGISQVSGETVEKKQHGADVEITRPLSGRALNRLAASLTVTGLDAGSTTWLSWLLLALGAWGAIALWKRDSPTALWVVGMCLLPIAVWIALLQTFDHWYNIRYTSAGLPAFLVLAVIGASDIVGRLPRPAVRAVLGAALFLMVAIPTWRASRSESWRKPPWREVADMLGDLTSEDEIVVTRDGWSRRCLGHYLDRLGRPVELVAADFDEARARAAIDRHSGAFVVSAGYRKAAWLQDWLGSLDLMLDYGQANLQVYYAPDFPALVGDPVRSNRLPSHLDRLGHAVTSQEFTGDVSLLGSGWAAAEVEPSGRTFRWAVGETAEIGVVGPQDSPRRELHLRVLPFPSPDRPPQELGVSINGGPRLPLALTAGWQDLVVPYTSPRTLDRVSFDFAWRQAPRDVDPASQDPRSLAVAFDRAASVEASGRGTD